MKRLLSVLTCIIIAFTAKANDSIAVAPIDSVSYALGHMYTAFQMEYGNSLLRRKSDYEEYMHGLEERISSKTLAKDSSYVMSYALGGMNGVFMTDEHRKDKDMALFHYIMEGVRKVAEGMVVLPTDTIEAITSLKRYGKADIDPEGLDETALREFFTAYGIMKTFQPRIQEYISRIKPGTGIKFDRQAYASGMADMLESFLTREPKSAYEQGKIVGISANMIKMERQEFAAQSFIAGAKAALGLGGQLIENELLEGIASKWLTRDSVVVEESQNDETEKITEYASSLDIELSTPYSVDWTITASKVATAQSPASQIFYDFLKRYELKDSILYGVLMVHGVKKASVMYDVAESKMKDFPLPDGYKWFYGKRENETLTLGIMETSNIFKATVREALVELRHGFDIICTPFSFDKADAKIWAKFTKDNVGNNIAIFINGIFAFAPRVNSQITDGRCPINGLPAEDVNRLFNGAVPVKPTAPNSIEIE